MAADVRPRRPGGIGAAPPTAMRARALWLVGVASILLAAGTSVATEPVAYAAEYKLRAFGLRGKLVVEQRPEPDIVGGEGAVWRYRSEISAKGIGRLFLGGTTFEDALFEVHASGSLRPLHITGEDTMKDRAKDVTFTWPDSAQPGAGPLAEGTDGEASFSLEMPPEVLDRALLIPAIALDLEASAAARDETGNLVLKGAPFDGERGYLFRVLERGLLRDYYARLLGEEMLEGPDGEPVNTLVFEHQRDGSSRATTFWLAPDLDYVPIQIQQRKDDKKPHMRAFLKDYQPLDPDQQPELNRDAR